MLFANLKRLILQSSNMYTDIQFLSKYEYTNYRYSPHGWCFHRYGRQGTAQ